MTAPDRAAQIAALRTVLDIAEAHPELPLPTISMLGDHHIYWWLYDINAPRHMAVIEHALPCELTASIEARDNGRDRYVLTGSLGGFAVEVSAQADLVADSTVTTETVEKREWIRKEPAPGKPFISDSTIAQARYFEEHPLNDDGTESEAQ